MIMFTALALLALGWLAMLVLKSSSRDPQAQASPGNSPTLAPTQPWLTAGRMKS